MMLGSRQAAVDYMTPLGLHHLMARGHHYGPGPWVAGGPRADWTSVYYHRADANGIGFDRTATGSNAVAQYFAAGRASASANLDTVDRRLPAVVPPRAVGLPHDLRPDALGRADVPLQAGVDAVRGMQATWGVARRPIDPERYEEMRAFLAIQEHEARWWRDASVLYFQTFSKRPIPEGYEKPEHDLDYYMKVEKKYVPGI